MGLRNSLADMREENKTICCVDSYDSRLVLLLGQFNSIQLNDTASLPTCCGGDHEILGGAIAGSATADTKTAIKLIHIILYVLEILLS